MLHPARVVRAARPTAIIALRSKGLEMAVDDGILDIVIMAAGQGTRMRSSRPKVLHKLAGKSLLQHVVECAAALDARGIVVVTGHGAAAVEASGRRANLVFVRQGEQVGTGRAGQQAAPLLEDGGTTLILKGDVPLIEPATARALVASC